jgi:hypothetical protein
MSARSTAATQTPAPVARSSQAPTTLDGAFDLITDELLETFLKKHQDYGKGNILANGEIGIAMRISEKIERLKHLLLTNQAPSNESVDDSWHDIAVYAIIATLYRRGQFQELEVGRKE